jgi:hypothetical protein
MISLRQVSILFLLTVSSFSLRSQEQLNLSQLEDSLSSLQRQIQKSSNDSVRQSLNTLFRDALKKAIRLPGSFTYPFDSLKKLAKLTSPDKMFRIYNWNLPVTGGSNQYFCFLQIREKTGKNNFNLVELIDRSDSVPDPEHSSLGSHNWYGAFYYRIILQRSASGLIYTLLGWEGRSLTEMQKLIEILTFDDKDLPHFGKKIFNKYKDGENKRIIFRYSPVAAMVLRYEEQSISKGKRLNASARTLDEKQTRAPMIVCDRLVPVASSESQAPVLVPAGDVYVGFIFENGRWNFMEDVDARNR